jgi:hypothetical protein
MSPKISLDFARVLRVVVRSKALECSPAALLDADPRTSRRLLDAAGIEQVQKQRDIGSAVRALLTHQRLITTSALSAIALALKERIWYTSSSW